MSEQFEVDGIEYRRPANEEDQGYSWAQDGFFSIKENFGTSGAHLGAQAAGWTFDDDGFRETIDREGALSTRELEALMDRETYAEEDKAALHQFVHVPEGVLDPRCQWCRKEIRPIELGGEGA